MSYVEWEEAERQRSVVDSASRIDLLIRDLPRYFNPPANTPYPLEYSSYLLGNSAGMTVLDYGCGAGENCVLLAKQGCKVIGMDLSPELIALAEQRMALHGIHDRYEFRVGSCHETGLQDHSLDGVFAIAILHHLDLNVAAREIKRILKPGGFLILQEPLRDNSLARLARRIFPATGPDISPFERPLTTKELLSVVDGMQVVAMRKFGLPHMKFFAGRLAYRIDGFLLNRFPFLAHYARFCVIKAIAR